MISSKEKNWVYNEIKHETSFRTDRKTRKVVSYGISLKKLEDRAIKGRKPHGNESGIPSRDKVRIIVKELIKEGRIEYVQSKGRLPSALIALKMDQRMQNERTFLYATYLHLLADLEKIALRAIARVFKEKDFFDYVRIKNELSAFPLLVYHMGLNSSDEVKSGLADDLLEQIKKKMPEIKKVEKYQKRRYSNFEQIIQAIEQLSKLQYELYRLFKPSADKKTKKRLEGVIRAQRNEIELMIKEGKTNHAR